MLAELILQSQLQPDAAKAKACAYSGPAICSDLSNSVRSNTDIPASSILGPGTPRTTHPQQCCGSAESGNSQLPFPIHATRPPAELADDGASAHVLLQRHAAAAALLQEAISHRTAQNCSMNVLHGASDFQRSQAQMRHQPRVAVRRPVLGPGRHVFRGAAVSRRCSVSGQVESEQSSAVKVPRALLINILAQRLGPHGGVKKPTTGQHKVEAPHRPMGIMANMAAMSHVQAPCMHASWGPESPRSEHTLLKAASQLKAQGDIKQHCCSLLCHRATLLAQDSKDAPCVSLATRPQPQQHIPVVCSALPVADSSREVPSTAPQCVVPGTSGRMATSHKLFNSNEDQDAAYALLMLQSQD
eukprot:364743-Chlamydomonas_euryale.AAC.4